MTTLAVDGGTSVANANGSAFRTVRADASSRPEVARNQPRGEHVGSNRPALAKGSWSHRRNAQDVPFSAEGWATFTGVGVNGSESDTEESLRKRLSQSLDIGDFTQGPLRRGSHTYNDGVGMTDAQFTPIVQQEAEPGAAADRGRTSAF